MTTNAPPTLSIKEQAEYVEALTMRCCDTQTKNFGPVLLSLELEDVEVLRALSKRLERMAPHEREIRKLVTGR
jgi:hypothetical protein